jgi:hypothetical protein
MAVQAVTSDIPIKVRRTPGDSIVVTAGASDVYYDSNYNQLATTVKGATPNGTKLAAGTQVIIPSWPSTGIMYFRAVADTTIFIEP